MGGNHLEFGKDELNKLAEKLGNVNLDHQERDLLLAIFAAAVDRTQVHPTGHGHLPRAISNPEAVPGKESTLDELRRQLLNSYFPSENELPVPDGFTAKVTGMPPPPPPQPR